MTDESGPARRPFNSCRRASAARGAFV